MEDFSELFVTLIIGIVIFLINSLGSKKQQQAENQHTPTIDSDDKEEEREIIVSEDSPRTLEDIFRELRKQKEIADKKEDYIPRAPKPQPAPQPFLQKEQEIYKPTIPEFTTKTETKPSVKQPISPIESEEISDFDETSFDPNEIDWRQTVVATEILNRKYT